MRFLKSIAAASAVAMGLLGFTAGAEAGPRYWGPYRGPVYHNHYDGGDVAVGIIGGLAVGTILGSALAAPRYVPAPVYETVPVYGAAPYSGDWYAYCASKYRSFDPRTGTYLGYDGYRHVCR